MRRSSDPSPPPPPSSSSTSPHVADADQASLSDVSSSISEENPNPNPNPNPSPNPNPNPNSAASFLSSSGSSSQRVKLMCSYGGRIMPRPHDNQLRYVGGESRIAVVNRTIALSELTAKLGRMFGSAIAIKYQLPCEDLDALISVTSDEDLENMMEEYDKLSSSSSSSSSSSRSSSTASRLRLFLFPAIERSSSSLLAHILEGNQSRERWFVDALNGIPALPRVRSETSSILSETPDLYSSTVDSLEEWAAAISYGNSSGATAPPLPLSEPSAPSSSLFASLVHHSLSSGIISSDGHGSNLAASDSTFTGSSSSSSSLSSSLSSSSSSSTTSMLSTIAESAFSKWPPQTQTSSPQQVGSDMDSNLMEVLLNSSSSSNTKPSGSSRSTVDQDPKKMQYVAMEIDVMSTASGQAGISRNINTTTSTTTTTSVAEQDDAEYEELASKRKVSDQVSMQKGTRIFEKDFYEATIGEESIKVVQQKRGLEEDQEIPQLLVGQPIFDEEAMILPPPIHVVKTQNQAGLLPLEEGITTTSTTSTTTTASILQKQAPSGDRLIQEGISMPIITSSQVIGEETSLGVSLVCTPSSVIIPPHGGASKLMTGDERLAPSLVIDERSVPNLGGEQRSALKLAGSEEDKLSQQISPVLIVEPSPMAVGIAVKAKPKLVVEDTTPPIHVNQIPSTNIKDASSVNVIQAPTTNVRDTLLSSSSSTHMVLLPTGQPMIQKTAKPPNFYLEETMSTLPHGAMSSGISHTAPLSAVDMTKAYGAMSSGISHAAPLAAADLTKVYGALPSVIPHNAPLSAVDLTKALAQQSALTSPPSSMLLPGNMSSMPTSGETLKAVTNANTPMVFSSSSGSTTGNVPHQPQSVEPAHLIHRQGLGDPLRGIVQPQPNSSSNRGYQHHHHHHHHQYIGVNPTANPSSGLSSQYWAVATPVEGIPLQSGFVPGAISEKNITTPVQRGATATPHSALKAPSAHYGYYAVEHSNTPSAHSTAVGVVVPMHNAATNVMIAGLNSAEPTPYVGGNPFVDDFSSQQAPLPSPPSDKLQKRQMRS